MLPLFQRLIFSLFNAVLSTAEVIHRWENKNKCKKVRLLPYNVPKGSEA
jgi:hypothetical protein